MTTPPRHSEYLPVEDLKPAKRNPKLHDIATIKASLLRFGIVGSMGTIDERTGRLVAGHGRREAMLELLADETPPAGLEVDEAGRWLVPIARGWRSRNNAEADAELLSDNRTVELGGWDIAQRGVMLGELGPTRLAGTGYTISDLPRPANKSTDPDGGEEGRGYQGPQISGPGDLWQIGAHRLIVGDCHAAGTWEALLDVDQQPTLVVTSPPYADRRKYDGSTEFRPVKPERYLDWYRPVRELIATHLAADGSYVLNIKEASRQGQRERYVLDLFVEHLDAGWLYVDQYAWPRGGFPIDPVNARRFKNGWEPCMHMTRNPRHKWRPHEVMIEGDGAFKYDPQRKLQGNDETGFLGVDRDGAVPGMVFPTNVLPGYGVANSGTEHSAAFPVGLPAWFVLCLTDPGDLVLDPFVGSGSTILAAHRHGRIGYGIELSPRYADQALARLEGETGHVPTRAGEPHSFEPAP